jgi:NADPH:quinone reductase
MRIIQVARFGGPEVLVSADAPDPVAGARQLVVATMASDVMFIDTAIRAGRAVDFFPHRPPYVPGNGVGGRVVSVGSGVDSGWLGQQVIAHTGGPGGAGGYAEMAVVNVDDVVAVPVGLGITDAVAVLHDGPTALRIADIADVQPGQRALILGAAGGMGILLIQLLRARGARVAGAARGKSKLEAVARAGAAAVDYSHPRWTAEVLDATEGARPDVVLDGVGGQLGHAAYEIIADGGRFSAHGTPSGSFAPIDAEDACQRGIKVISLRDLGIGPGERADLARRILADVGSARISPLIGQTFSLAEAAKAHSAIEARDAIAKTLLVD